jgi:hypothetical protein
MSSKTENASRQPEALATFAAAARSADKVSPNGGLKITEETGPLPTSLDAQQDAATKVLREGVLRTDQGAMEAVDALPDRTRASDKP